MKQNKNDIKELKKTLNKKEKKSVTNYLWICKITILALFISFTFSFISEMTIPKVNIWVGIIIALLFILIGVLFDMVGVSVAAASVEPFHSMGARKIRGAKIAIRLKKNADKVSTFCNDVIGDICGIISGSAGVMIATSIASHTGFSMLYTSLLVTAIIASLTIGGKAWEKTFAMNKSNLILYEFSKILSIFIKE